MLIRAHLRTTKAWECTDLGRRINQLYAKRPAEPLDINLEVWCEWGASLPEVCSWGLPGKHASLSEALELQEAGKGTWSFSVIAQTKSQGGILSRWGDKIIAVLDNMPQSYFWVVSLRGCTLQSLSKEVEGGKHSFLKQIAHI